MISNGGPDGIHVFQNLITSIGDVNDMVGVMLLTMIIGGDTFTHMITSFKEKTFLITCIGDEVLGEMSIGGGIAKQGNFMTLSTNPQKVTLDGGMVFLTIKTCLHITWTYLLLGYDTMKIFLDFGDVIEHLPIG